MKKQARILGIAFLTLLILFMTVLPAGAVPAAAPCRQGSCPTIPSTPSFTYAYGTCTLDGAPCPVDTVVTAISPRGDTVGCFVVHTAGHYGSMVIYGEDTSATPPIPGMRAGESVAFQINGAPATGSLTWSSDKLPHEVNLSATTASETFDLPMVAGWNLGSFPIVPANPAVSALTAGTADKFSAIFAYDAADAGDHWKSYYSGVGGDLTTLDHAQGFWVHATEPYTLSVQGSLPATTAIPLTAGWNLVGYPSQTSRPVQVATAGITGNLLAVQTYDPTSESWQRYRPGVASYVNTLTEMEPGIGYWINVDANCTWTVSY